MHASRTRTIRPRGRNLLMAGAWLGLVALASSCGPGLADPATQPPAYEPAGLSKCSVAKSQSAPLIVEWPSAERLALETLAKQGVVAVKYSGCEMEVLGHCKVPGKYAYLAATRQDDELRITNEDELYASIPVYAAKFEAKLASAGQLNVSMSMVGRWVTDQVNVEAGQLEGHCQGATHLLAGLTVGAFEFSAGASTAAGAGVEVGPVGAGVSRSAARETLNRAGDRAACNGSTDHDDKPPSGCGALLRVEVVPIIGAEPPPAPAVASDTGPSNAGDGDRDGDGYRDSVDACPDEVGRDRGCPERSSGCVRGRSPCDDDADCCSDERCDTCPVSARSTTVHPWLAQEACPPARCVRR